MHRSRALYVLLVALLIMTPFGLAAQSTPSYHMRTSVFGSAGSPVSGAGTRLHSTLGQLSVIGVSSNENGIAYLGFWKDGWRAMITDAGTTPPISDRLFQNYPNPFNPETTISFSLSGEGFTELIIYNVKGQRVRTLVREQMDAGSHEVSWNGRNDGGRAVSSGIYFYRLRAGSFESVKKMVLLR